MEWDSFAEFSLLNSLTHTQAALIRCHVAVLALRQQFPSCPLTECDSYKPEEQHQ